jgi:hypothetical protein
MKRILFVVLGVFCWGGVAFGGQLSVGNLTGGFTTGVITDGMGHAVVEKFIGDLTDDGYICLSEAPPEDFQEFTYCEIQKNSYDEHISIGTTWGVGIDADKARVVVTFTLAFKNKANLNLFPAEFRNLINRIGGKL